MLNQHDFEEALKTTLYFYVKRILAIIVFDFLLNYFCCPIKMPIIKLIKYSRYWEVICVIDFLYNFLKKKHLFDFVESVKKYKKRRRRILRKEIETDSNHTMEYYLNSSRNEKSACKSHNLYCDGIT